MLKKIVPALAAMFIAAPALAGDLPSAKSAPVFPVVEAFDWTGFYIGVDGGAVWGSARYKTTGVSANDLYSQGFGGGYVGANKQFGNIVLGLEGDIQGFNGVSNSTLFSVRQNILAAVNGRAGVTFDGSRGLVYVLGGVAFNNFQHSFGANWISDNQTGFDVGGGAEYFINPNWAIRAEYRYYGFGTKSFPGFAGVNFNPGYSIANWDQTFRVGVEYKFGSAPVPVVAKY